jgi:hypothetical protein
VVLGDEGKAAVALVVLERKECKALHVEGSDGHIWVLGNGPVPGMIHVDSTGDGTSCITDEEVINVNSNTNDDAIVAYEAEDPHPDSGVVEAGIIGIYGLLAATVSDSQASDEAPRVWAGPSPGSSPVGRKLVTRSPVHEDYAQGVGDAMYDANLAWATPSPDVTVSGAACSGTGPPTPDAPGTWYFDCPQVSYNGNVALRNATKVVISGQLVISPNKYFALPKATEVYVNAPTSADVPGLVVKGQFRMHTGDGDGSTPCSGVSAPSTRARLVIGNGGLPPAGPGGPLSILSEGSAPLFRACNTSVIMMG